MGIIKDRTTQYLEMKKSYRETKKMLKEAHQKLRYRDSYITKIIQTLDGFIETNKDILDLHNISLKDLNDPHSVQYPPYKINSLSEVLFELDKIKQHYSKSFQLLDKNVTLEEKHHGEILSKITNAKIIDKISENHQSVVDKLFYSRKKIDRVKYLLQLNAINRDIIENFPIGQPIQGRFIVSSHFGIRMDPFTHTKKKHYGVDLISYFKKIYNTLPGYVHFAGYDNGYGFFVEIRSENGFAVRYAHLRKILVKKGEIVKKGQVIGIMGSSGKSTSTHLHYEILLDGTHVNPYQFIHYDVF